MPHLKIPPKFARFEKPKRYKIALGGRGSAKSMTCADLLLMCAGRDGEKIGCFREYQNSIEDSIHSLLEDEIERLGATGFSVGKQTINHASGGLFRFAGLARNPESIKSMNGFKKFFVEEAQTISAKSLKLLTPTLREAGSEVWMAANPLSSADPFSQRFIVPWEKELRANGFYEDDLHTIILMNYMDNPWFPGVLEQERAHDEKTLSRAEYNHIWLGHYNDTVENAIISVDWFDAAIDAHKKLGFKPLGAKIASHDPSDEGGDDDGYCLRHGSVILDVQSNPEGDVNEGCDWALGLAIEAQADYYTWDCDGMGVALKRQVGDTLDGKRIETVMFKGSESPDNPNQIYLQDKLKDQRTNKQVFRNKRAQHYWALRDRFAATYQAVTKGVYTDPDQLISLDSSIEDMDSLRAEVCRIPKKSNANGFIQIMSKEDMAKLDIASPNMADALMMSMITPPPKIDATGFYSGSSSSGWMS